MRITLAKLKAMDKQELAARWGRGAWPFDLASGCGLCLTQHAVFDPCSVPEHLALKTALPPMSDSEYSEDYAMANLEALYAAREFFPFWAKEPVASGEEVVEEVR